MPLVREKRQHLIARRLAPLPVLPLSRVSSQRPSSLVLCKAMPSPDGPWKAHTAFQPPQLPLWCFKRWAAWEYGETAERQQSDSGASAEGNRLTRIKKGRDGQVRRWFADKKRWREGTVGEMGQQAAPSAPPHFWPAASSSINSTQGNGEGGRGEERRGEERGWEESTGRWVEEVARVSRREMGRREEKRASSSDSGELKRKGGSGGGKGGTTDREGGRVWVTDTVDSQDRRGRGQEGQSEQEKEVGGGDGKKEWRQRTRGRKRLGRGRRYIIEEIERREGEGETGACGEGSNQNPIDV